MIPTQSAPSLPPRPPHPIEPPHQNDEPPPAYTPTPHHETTLQVGPRYPFDPNSQNLTHQPNNYSNHQTQSYQPSHLQNDWNGPNPQQSQNNAFLPPSTEPTSFPSPGKPLLFEDKVLIYPYVNGVCYFCPKCCNTGFKGFDASRPCRKCWLKYGKPWNVVRLSPMTNATMANFQRPLPPTGFMTSQPPPLVVRPGDPRIGGRLCLNCNGSGSRQEELNLFNMLLGGGGSEVCINCRGTGRIF